MTVAIIEPAITQYVAEGRELVHAIHVAEHATAKLEEKLVETRLAAQARRMELGALLLRVRETLPRRGTRENGWLAFLEAIEVDDSTAHRYMELARNPASEAATSHESSVRSNGAHLSLVPDPDVPHASEGPEPEQTEPEVEIDRDTWCTPKWIADAIGSWDLDPCSNERSHIRASRTYSQDAGQDGLHCAKNSDRHARVFINPPYSDVRPWIDAYGHTRFCFLLKLDPSTKWFAALHERCELILLPRGTRVEFEAPPGVPPEKSGANPFPHALFFARAEDATPEIRAACFEWHVTR